MGTPTRAAPAPKQLYGGKWSRLEFIIQRIVVYGDRSSDAGFCQYTAMYCMFRGLEAQLGDSDLVKPNYALDSALALLRAGADIDTMTNALTLIAGRKT